MATKAQKEALAWLVQQGMIVGIHSAALQGLYEVRYRQGRIERGIDHWPLTQSRQSAWRRTSGRAMSRMKDDGLMEWDGWSSYTPNYKITEAGLAAASDILRSDTEREEP